MIHKGDKGTTRKKRRATKSDLAAKSKPAINAEQRLAELAWQRRLAWLRRPQIHPSMFEEPLENEVETAEAVAERAGRSNALAEKLGWSEERLASFKQLVLGYEKRPTVANYLQIRCEFPEVEIQVGRFGGIEALFALEKEFASQGIDPMLIAGVLDGNEPGIDELCLRLLELITSKDELPKEGPGSIAKRRQAISDATINYLIVEILEGVERWDDLIRIPASLILLIRERLCGSNPDLHQSYLTRERFREAVFNAGLNYAQTGKPISIRKLAAAAGVSRATAARWRAHEDFSRLFERGRSYAASEDFVQLKETMEKRYALGREPAAAKKKLPSEADSSAKMPLTGLFGGRPNRTGAIQPSRRIE